MAAKGAGSFQFSFAPSGDGAGSSSREAPDGVSRPEPLLSGLAATYSPDSAISASMSGSRIVTRPCSRPINP